MHTWATTNSENVIILTKDSEKDNFTCMSSIISNYQIVFLPMITIWHQAFAGDGLSGEVQGSILYY